MAEQGDLPRLLRKTHERYRTPYVAILVSAGIMLVFTLASSFLTALTISTISRLLTFAVSCLALPVLRRRSDVEPARFVLPGGPAIPLAAVVLTAWLLSNSSRTELVAVAAAALAGTLVFWTAHRRLGRSAAEAEAPPRS
jgi:amino acid transporter